MYILLPKRKIIWNWLGICGLAILKRPILWIRNAPAETHRSGVRVATHRAG